MKKAIITGVTGQDGSYMAEYLLENTDLKILGGIRRTSQLISSNLSGFKDHPRYMTVPVDLCDTHSITSLIKNEKPSYFFNFGSVSFVADSWSTPSLVLRANAESLIHICEAIRNYAPQCKLYSAGSSEQWGDVAYSPQDINHPMRPRSVYGISKCAAGLVCKVYRESYGIFAVHGILTNHESERRQDYFVTRKCTLGVARIRKAILNGQSFEPIELGNLNAKRDWSYAPDFIDGIWKMLQRETPKDYVLSSNETHSIREFVEKAFGYAGFKCTWIGKEEGEKFVAVELNGVAINTPVVVINPKFYRPAEVDLLLGDSTPARKELNWSPTTNFEQLVEKMVAHDVNSAIEEAEIL